jgi:hypothetical protein
MDQLPGDKAGQFRAESAAVEADSPDTAKRRIPPPCRFHNTSLNSDWRAQAAVF